MATSIVDRQGRVILPAAKPGDVFDIQNQGEGRMLLVRLDSPQAESSMNMARCLEAIGRAPLRPTMSWKSLKAMTREP